MENVKKKRPEVNGAGKTSGKKMRAKKERSNGGVTGLDAELEEFFAILNRLQAGFDHFKNKDAGDGVGQPPQPPPAATDSGFKVEDFVQLHDGRRKISAGDAPQNDVVFGFDLNADPGSDPMSD